jgi:hypothetical protein
MQRKSTKQSPGANAAEKRHMSWLKERGICSACGNDAGVICHHSAGSSFKIKVDLKIVLIGHAFVLGLCYKCDSLITNGSRKQFFNVFGKQSELWINQYIFSPVKFDEKIILGIINSGK